MGTIAEGQNLKVSLNCMTGHANAVPCTSCKVFVNTQCAGHQENLRLQAHGIHFIIASRIYSLTGFIKALCCANILPAPCLS